MLRRLTSTIALCAFGLAQPVLAERVPDRPNNVLSEENIESILEANLPRPPENQMTKKLMANFKLNNRLISLWAEKMRSEGNIIVAEGAVRLQLGTSELIAQEIRLDPDQKTAVAVGRDLKTELLSSCVMRRARP